ncbi:protein of unknown function [Hyphomicrobium sp. MC1]|nr:protein of unknown function [Hyphomicrobium sp. MC1]
MHAAPRPSPSSWMCHQLLVCIASVATFCKERYRKGENEREAVSDEREAWHATANAGNV